MMHNWSFFGMSMMWLVWLPLLALVVWFVVQAVRKSETADNNRPTPEDILRNRFARGELSKEELEEKLETLHKY